MAAAEHQSSCRSGAHTLAAHDLRLDRGARTIIGGLSFVIEAGQVLILRGANGSGKTSLLRILAGFTLPDAGVIKWNGELLKALSPTWREAALYLGHINALKDDLSAHENLVDALAIDGISTTPAAQLQALDKVGLLDCRGVMARRLSQGQKRRVGLARLSLALTDAPHKQLWLLDEPTNALDADGVLLFTNLIRAHLERGGIACIATHLALDLALPVKEISLDALREVA